MEQGVWQKYKDQGVVVWGIASDDYYDSVVFYTEQLGLSFPVLFDEGGVVNTSYNSGPKFTNSRFPQDWVIGVDGTVVYVSNQYDPEVMTHVIEQELAKAAQKR